MLKKSVRQGGNRKLGGGKDVEGADAPEQLRKLQLQVITDCLIPYRAVSHHSSTLNISIYTVAPCLVVYCLSVHPTCTDAMANLSSLASSIPAEPLHCDGNYQMFGVMWG